jgi:NADH-quinone oxidoreductase subunit H
MILVLLQVIFLIVFVLISVAYFTLVERKIMASIQRRRGPNVIGYLGLLQPLADGLKLFVKETVIPASANKVLYFFATYLSFLLSLVGWSVIPFGDGLVLANINAGLLFLFAISSLSVYGILLSGWSSNSNYSLLGALRSASQMISYEVSIGFIVVTIGLCAGSFNLSAIVYAQKEGWLLFPLLPMFLLFFVSALAETNRHPFDLPEAEAELVSGYNVEYAAMGFAYFFLAEYANMLLMSSLISVLFLGGWYPQIEFFYTINFMILPMKICLFVLIFCWVRAILPRYRFDQLMYLGWKTILPLSISWVFFTSSTLISFNWIF